MVEECNNEETGVGPSIAMGSQYDCAQIADFLRTAINAISQLSTLQMSNISAKSPARLYITAAIDDPTASPRIQNEIKIIDINPIHSHPKVINIEHLLIYTTIPTLK